jgi:two-component system NtrC family response regulator
MTEARLIDPADLELAARAEASPDLDLRAARLRAERDVLEKAVTRANGTLATAAKLLGISRPTLYGLMEAHGIAIEPGRTADVSTEAEDTKVDTE